MSKLDILFIKPGSQKQIYGQLSNFLLTAIEPPFWAALWAGYLRRAGWNVAILDAELENLDWSQTAERVIQMSPRIAVVSVSGSNPSASTMNMTGAGLIVKKIKELTPEIKTVLAGLHPSALPLQTMQTESADFLCQGEGFETLSKLVKAVKNNDDNYKIDGLWYRDNGQICSNPMSELIKDLDNLPQPGWDLLEMNQYRAHNWHCFDDIKNRQPYAVLYTSLGCPFNCSFCCINSMFGKNTIRYRGIDSVIDEIDFLVNSYGIKNIKIMDEMFAMNQGRTIELCEKIIERKYDLNMWAYARVNTVTPEMITKMKHAGINWLAYGFESGSSKVIKDVTKGYDMSLVDEVVKMTYDAGIYICGNYIFGLPEDDNESMEETMQMMLDINAEWANIYCAMAYPGSQLYDTAISNNWPLPQSWDAFSQYSYESLPLPTKHLSAGQVLDFRDKAFEKYYKNPKYLDMISKKFGQDTLEHVKKMSEKKLKRRYVVN